MKYTPSLSLVETMISVRAAGDAVVVRQGMRLVKVCLILSNCCVSLELL